MASAIASLMVPSANMVLRKVPHTHRYQVTARGRRTITALLAAHSANTDELTKVAA
jgi:hypothetical protein